MRTLLLVVFAFLSACGPEVMPQGPGGSSTSPSSPSADAGVAVLDGGAEEVDLELAKRVWDGQAKHREIALNVRDGDCENAISWVRAASRAAGRPVSTGTVSIDASGRVTWSEGGTTLRLSKPGWTGELAVAKLVGDPRNSFPLSETDRLDATWRHASGGWLRCDLEWRRWSIVGDTTDLDGRAISVELTSSFDAASSTVDFTTIASGTSTLSGELRREGSGVVHFQVDGTFSACIGTQCGQMMAADYSYQHAVALELDGQSWDLDYTDGYQQLALGSPKARYWSGTIHGPQAGSLTPRSQNGAWALDAVIGASRHTVELAPQVVR